MAVETMHRGVVIGADHFVDRHDEVVILPDVLGEPEFSQRITGIWLPKSVIDDDNRAQAISQIALGSRSKFSLETPPQFRLIYDTSSSGAVEDTLEHLDHIAHYYPAPHMTFTISLGGFSELFEAAIAFSEEQWSRTERKVDYLLTTAYPENDLNRFGRVTKFTPDNYTRHVSEVADDYGFKGVVGAGSLARFTRVGQYYLALGVGKESLQNYEIDLKKWGAKVCKRVVAPEETFEHATNTEAQLSRSLFDDGHGEYMYPSIFDSEAANDEIAELVKRNLRGFFDILDNLPEPKQLDS